MSSYSHAKKYNVSRWCGDTNMEYSIPGIQCAGIQCTGHTMTMEYSIQEIPCIVVIWYPLNIRGLFRVWDTAHKATVNCQFVTFLCFKFESSHLSSLSLNSRRKVVSLAAKRSWWSCVGKDCGGQTPPGFELIGKQRVLFMYMSFNHQSYTWKQVYAHIQNTRIIGKSRSLFLTSKLMK
jgi:hypothetical protein